MPPQNDSGYGGISMAEYCDLLFRDLGYHKSSQRRGWLKLRFNNSYLDELTETEKYKSIQALKSEKYGDDIE